MWPAKILIVEDEPIIADHVQHLLEQDGHEVWTAAQAAEAANLCAKHLPDLALLNFHQKDSADGMALACWLHSEYLMKVLFITGARPKDMAGSMDYYAAHKVLHKPFTRRQLRTALLDSLQELA